MHIRASLIAMCSLLLASFPCQASDTKTATPAERGRKALTTRAFLSATYSLKAYDNVWRQWEGNRQQKPANYKQAVMDRYGLHPAPFANGKFPMGLREGTMLFSKGVASDCMLCHASSLLGKSYIGLGNASLDLQALFSELGKASGRNIKLPFAYSHVRGTTEAGNFAVFLLSLRQPNLSFRVKPMELNLRDYLCEDVPAWWLLQKKKTMYATGATPARSVRSIMQFMLASTKGEAGFNKEEATFRDIQAYILGLKAPKYPFVINHKKAALGKQLFKQNCARCHGTYGKNWTYPNRIVPGKIIGTDSTRLHGISRKWGHYYNSSWFAKEKKGWLLHDYQVHGTPGYQAPPLDGVWATAPYLHNASVPTVYHVLNSKTRPKIFTRSYRTDAASYDKTNVGWKFQVLPRGAAANMPGIERRKIYDTRQPGRGNQGHTFGDRLTETERRAVIEYLKTL